jgi:hypothetical protein
MGEQGFRHLFRTSGAGRLSTGEGARLCRSHRARATAERPRPATGYDARGLPVLRDEFIEGRLRNSVADTYGPDGRLLTRSFSSPTSRATSPTPVNYDSAGHPVELTNGLLGPAKIAYWSAGSGAADPATGPYDALFRLTTTQWDNGLGSTTRGFYPNSNLPSGYAVTLPGAAGSRFKCILQGR